MRAYQFNLITIILSMAFIGIIVVAIMLNKGANEVLIWSTAGTIFSLTCILSGCVIYNERTAVISKYFNKRMGFGEEKDFLSNYKASLKVKLFFIAVIVTALIFIFALNLSFGVNYFEITDVFRLIYQHLAGYTYDIGSADWWGDLVLWDVRLPKMLVAIVAGSALAVGGAVMQSVVKNPLADPYTTGISSGAVFGVSLALVLGFTVGGAGQYGLILNAFIFSLIPALIMIFVSRISNGSHVTIILVGTAVSFIFSAFSTLVMSIANEDSLKDAFVWQVGSLNGASWSWLPLMFSIAVTGSIILYATSGKLNLLMMGDNEAKALGLNVDNYRMMCLIILSFITASVVSYIGVIGFLGLVTPHIVRMFMGSNTKYVIPASALLGATILLAAQFISTNIGINDLPVGVVMSFIGGPMFLLLILSDRKEVWD